MGNVTSNLIETAIQSANSDSDLANDNAETSDSSKLELYRLLREKMEDSHDSHQKNVVSPSSAAGMVPPPAKESVMMAPKKKFLIGYRGDEDEVMCEKTDAGNPVVDVAAKVSPTSSADVARSRSHTVSLPFRSRAAPPQAEVPRRPLIESKVSAEAACSAATIRSCIMTAIDSRVGTPSTTQPSTPQLEPSVGRAKPLSVASELASPVTVPPLASVSHDVRLVLGGEVSADKCQIPQQRTTSRVNVPGTSLSALSHSPRGGQHHPRDTAAMMEPGGRQVTQMVEHARDQATMLPEPGSRMVDPSTRQMTQVVDHARSSMSQMAEHARDRPTMLSEPGSRVADHSTRHNLPHISNSAAKYDTIVTTHPGMVDRRFFQPSQTDRSPPQLVDRRFAVPVEYWKDAAAADDRRKLGVGYHIADHRDAYTTQVPSRYIDPHSFGSDRGVSSASHFSQTNIRSLPADQAAASYASHSVDVTRGWAGQQPSTDSYRHGIENRAGRHHYDMGDVSQHGRKFAANETRMCAAEYNAAIAAPDRHVREPMIVQHQVREPMTAQHQLREPVAVQHHVREPITAQPTGVGTSSEPDWRRLREPITAQHQLREPITAQSGGGSTSSEPDWRRPAPHHPQLQPVEPSVRPRIAGLTHGDPSTYEQPSPQVDSSRYSSEHAYRSTAYDVIDRRRPNPDVLNPFAPSEPKQARRHSPYYASGAAWTSRTGSLSLRGDSGSGSGSSRGDFVPRVTSESPLDLTVRKQQQAMTAEAFLRRCHDSSQRSHDTLQRSHDLAQQSGQYTSPGRHGSELQYSSLWTATRHEGLEVSSAADVCRQVAETSYPGHVAGIIPRESSYPGHVVQRAGDAVRPVYSAVRDYHPNAEMDVRRQHAAYPHQRRADDDDVQMLYSRRETDPRWDLTRQPASSMTASPVVRPTYWDSRYVARPVQATSEMMESVADSRTQRSSASYVGDAAWMGDHSQYGARVMKTTGADAVGSMDRRSHCTEVSLTSSPHGVPTAAASRRIPMVQLLGGKYSPSDILHLCCKVCGSTYGSLRSFRLHFAKAHGQEPTPENFTIQTISDARIQALSQRSQEPRMDEESPPTLQMESTVAAVTNVGRDVALTADVDQHKRNIEFAPSVPAKARSVAEVQPMQKKATVLEGPPTPISKPSPPDEATKRSGEDRRMKCKKCGQFVAQDLSLLRKHVHSHADWTGMCTCDCSDVVESDTGCAVCLEGFNDVSDWQLHVTSQHMMRSCICKSCDLGFTNASALRRHLTATHDVDSPNGSTVEVEYRCLFCPEAFTNEHLLYAHTRAHEQHYSTQRMCSRAHHSPHGSSEMRVQTAVPDTTCPEDQRASTMDVSPLDAPLASCTSDMCVNGKENSLLFLLKVVLNLHKKLQSDYLFYIIMNEIHPRFNQFCVILKLS